ncbi:MULTISPECIES: heme-degrading domain-containing protein [unclassified Oceanispirochaeta]|uniref:heme-degrading domain-containing protein n=1 Tax=unclassified Oceanispirochaeta TaxID=2635722 RepID=UPI000E095C84|nr:MULTISPECIES: heme-binding protein [unclassified Oceanispirochaeta]MBF9016661.1 heme-binding protein [Oceanispirochaeta sp. M2]NPD73134.1 hypothetical protein [Oceanispirochaeta sp. M1]RDG31234.1 hypothetical protein DV872_13600 [Oceanispirochaeta sp. M1]
MKSLSELLEEEKSFCFDTFTEKTAWALGCAAVKECMLQDLPVAIRIERDEQILFQSALKGSCRDNDLWLGGKARLVRHFRHSSFYISRKLIKDKEDLYSKYILKPELYRAKGGGIPLFLKDGIIAAVLIISGLKDNEDHDLAVKITKDFLKEEIASP